MTAVCKLATKIAMKVLKLWELNGYKPSIRCSNDTLRRGRLVARALPKIKVFIRNLFFFKIFK